MKNHYKPHLRKFQAFKWVVFILPVLIIFGCSSPPAERNYYIISYNPIPENPDLILDQPLPYRVEVSNSRISRIYDRSQLVFRYSPHTIEYSNNDLWAVRLSASIPDALTNHLVKYNTFATTQRDFLLERPHYEVGSTVNQIEMLRSEFYYGFNINMDIFLRRSDDMEYVVRHSLQRESEIFTDNPEVFVQQVSRVINEETDIFIEKVLRHFEVFTDEDIVEPEIDVEDEERVDEPTVPISRRPAERDRELSEEQLQTWLMPPPREQLIRESRRDLVGMGRVFLPAMSNPDAEPFYTLLSAEQHTNFFERMGSSIYLKPGDYTLYYGSGAENQRMSRDITVIRDYTHIIEPDWGGLRVRVINENRESLDSQYEIFRVPTAESYGYGQGALEELGEILMTWILEPGTYKIVLNNFPYNILEDFVTIDVVEGELRTLTLVVDSETNKLKGAGIIDGLEHTRELRDWRFSSTIHGNFSLNYDNLADRLLYTIDTQLDNRLNFDRYPYYYTAHHLMDLGFSKERDEEFRLSSDSFKLRNTFVYYFSRVIGLYARGDVETHLFAERIYEDTRNHQLVDSDGKEIGRRYDQDSFRVKPSFFPLIFREGAGINIRPLNRPRASLNLRFGFGMRQDINTNVYGYDFDVVDIDGETFHRYKAIDSSFREGLEFSILANLHLPFRIIYNTTADVLIPFRKDESTSYSWENVFTLRMIRQAAIDYKINIAHPVMNDTEITHNVILRLTYFLY